MEFRVNKEAGIHVAIGKVSFDDDAALRELPGADRRGAPGEAQRAKGQYLRKVALSSTMGPGVRIESARGDGGRRRGEASQFSACSALMLATRL